MRFSGGNQQKQIGFCIYVKKAATYYDDFYVVGKFPCYRLNLSVWLLNLKQLSTFDLIITQ